MTNSHRIALSKHILPALGHLSLQKVTLRIMQQFYNQKLDEGQSPSSVITMHKVLHQALAYAVKERLLAVNPCTGVSLPSEETRKVQSLTVEQAQHLLQEVQGTMMEPFLALAVVVGINTSWGTVSFTVARHRPHSENACDSSHLNAR